MESEPFKTKLLTIHITPVGKITSLHLENITTNYKSIIELKTDITNKKIDVTNIKITDNNTLLVTPADFQNITMMYENNMKDIPENAIKIVKIIYSNDALSGNCYTEKVVNSLFIELKQSNKDTKAYIKILEQSGFMQVQSTDPKTVIFKIEQIWLRHLLTKDKHCRELFDNFGIISTIDYQFSINEYRLLKHSPSVELEETNTYKTNLNKWMSKAKLLGIYEDYEIYCDTLIGYKGKDKSKNPLIPPIRNLNLAYDQRIFILDVPDSVTVMESTQMLALRQLNLGKNTLYMEEKTFTLTQNTFDTKNLNCDVEVTIKDKLTYRLQFGLIQHRKETITFSKKAREVELIEQTDFS